MTDKPSAAVLQSRRAGVGLHITSLPGRYGIGEIGGQARVFIDFMVEAKLAVWQILPTGPTAFGNSPYQALSTFAGNEMLIDVDMLVAIGLLENTELTGLLALPPGNVDYDRLIPLKSQLLQLAASRFEARAGSAMRSACEAFIARHDSRWLHDYALYRSLKSLHGERPWPDWRPEFVHRHAAALRNAEQSQAAQIAGSKVLQFLFHEQWRALRDYARSRGVVLFGDIPIYIALDSADAWAHPEMLQIDADGRPAYVAGVPPDYFSEDGQLWGNPLYAWQTHAASHYRWWIERIQSALSLTDLLRVDHFRGFESYWSVPANAKTARQGSWQAGPGDALFDALAEALGELPIVAEDLGVITPAVDTLRNRHRLPGMVVLQFDVASPRFDVTRIAANSVCYTGTHDNDTTRGWFHGSPGDIRDAAEIRRTREAALRATQGSVASIHDDMIRLAFSSPANLAIAPMQDYLGLESEARMNTPGTPAGNWRWRLHHGQADSGLCEHIATMVAASGRGFGVD